MRSWICRVCGLTLCTLLMVAHPPSCTAAAPQDMTISLTDADHDGLEDALESKLGTNPNAMDTDGDGLADYAEYCKYRTDPAKADSDGDGKKDGNAKERREYAYTIRTVLEIRPPCDAATMGDIFQDVISVKPGRLPDSKMVELVIYPFATPHICPQPYSPDTPLPKALLQYTEPTLAMNYSPEMRAEVRKIVKGAKTDVEAIQMILRWIASNTSLANYEPEFAYFCVRDNKIEWRDPKEPREALLETNFYGDSMFKRRVHGTCTSLANLRGTMLRAAGIPTRYIQTLPLITRYEGDPEPLTDRMRKRTLASGYDLGPHGGGANHCYNEVFLDGQWVRVDDIVGRGTFVGSRLFVKAYSVADWNNVLRIRPAAEAWNERRDMRPVLVEDALASYTSDLDFLDIAVVPGSLSFSQQGDRSAEARVSIRNNGTVPSPQFSLLFCSGDPDKGGRVLSPHAAGPIMPGDSWNEGSQLTLEPGDKELWVVIDREGETADKDTSNNRASVPFSR